MNDVKVDGWARGGIRQGLAGRRGRPPRAALAGARREAPAGRWRWRSGAGGTPAAREQSVAKCSRGGRDGQEPVGRAGGPGRSDEGDGENGNREQDGDERVRVAGEIEVEHGCVPPFKCLDGGCAGKV